MAQWPGWQPQYLDPRFNYQQPAFIQPPLVSPGGWFPHDPYQQPLQSPHGIGGTHPRSIKYPKLNPALAEDTTLIRYDVKQKPAQSIVQHAFQATRSEFALATPTKHMRLISRAFPWAIDIVTEANVTCEDVWRALWNSLQQNLVDSEWGFLIREKGMYEKIEKAIKKRVEADPKADKHPKRIDVLGDATLFRGLELDIDFAKQRLLPFAKKCDETWTVKLSD